MKFSAIVVTNDISRMKFSCDYILAHSSNLTELVIVWDGKDGQILGYLSPEIQWLSRHTIPIQILNGRDRDVYGMFNLGASKAKEDWILFFNDDMYFPPAWDVLESFIFKDRDVITFNVVEPGYVDVSEKNLKKDFGQTIETFDKAGFDNFCNGIFFDRNKSFFCQPGLGWYMPVLFPKKLFNDFGQYPTYPPFPYPNDVQFFEVLKRNSVDFYQIYSCIYHFQRLSQRTPKLLLDKLNLCCGPDLREGYLNVDKPDFDLSEGVIPYPDNSFSEVVFQHALEHFRFQTGILILNEIRRILKPNGVLEIRVPDLKQACKDYLAGKNEFENCAPAIQRIYGQNFSEELVHKWGYSYEVLLECLKATGFSVFKTIEDKFADEIAIKAWKPENV